ncbi:MAG: amidohydrolase family protein [Acidobacteriia bacterium]|nr:amidohydrolase family protein [Terriglobia bacterium]
MRLDAHQHFWRYNQEEYPWIGRGMELLRRDFLPADFLPLLQSIGFDGSIAVQARQSVQETAWLLELADQYAFIRGVVGWLDLCGPELKQQLERFAEHGKFCGVRHVIHDEPDDLFMLREDFSRGIGLLAEFNLAYDLLLFPRHLRPAADLVARHSRQRFVLDHIAKPHVKDGVMEPWVEDIRRLAHFSNVACKISGMVTEADWHNWKPDDFTPYLDVVFEAFGADRIMIGSDWPVCTVSAPFHRVMSMAMDYVRRLSDHEQKRVLGKNALTFYRIYPQEEGVN